MPLSIRELFLVVRARDEATNTLRRVGQNLGRLQTATQVRGAQAAVASQLANNIAQQEKLLAESNAAVTLRQKEFGDAQVALAEKRVALQNKLNVATERQNTLYAQGQAALDKQTAAQERLVGITKEQDALQQRINAHAARAQTAVENARTLGLPAVTGVDAGAIRKLQEQQAQLQRQAAAVNKEIAVQEREVADLATQYRAVTGVVTRYTAALEENGAAAAAAAEENKAAVLSELSSREASIAKLKSAQAGLIAQQGTLNARLQDIKSQNFDKAAHAAGNLGRTMQYMGAISVAALGFAANSAAHLQSSVGLAATQVANSVKGVATESQKDFAFILQEMRKFPAASADMSASLYDIFSTLNVNGRQGRIVLDQVNKAAVAGQISVQQATQGVLSVLNNFKLSWKDTGSVLNRTFAAVRFGRATLDQFQTALQTMAPAAKAAQQSFNTLAGTFAFLSRSLGPAKAAVGFARLEEVLNGPQMQKGLKGFGVSLQDANGHIKPLNQQIDILVKRFPYLTRGGTQALNFFKNIGGLQGTIQARRAFETIVSNVQGYRNLLGKTIHDNNEFNKSYTALARTAGVQWGVFLNTLKSVFITIGAAVLPTFLKLVHPLQEAADWFNKLDKASQNTIGRFAALAAIGATLVGTILSVGAGLALMANQLSAATGLGVGFAGIARLVPIIAGLAVVGKLIYDNWSTLEPLFSGLLGVLKEFGGLIKTVFDAIPGPIKTLAVDVLGVYTAARLLVSAWKAFTALSLVRSVITLTGALTGLTVAEAGAATGAEALLAALGGWPVLAVAAGIGAVVGALYLLGGGSNKAQQDVSRLQDALGKLKTAGENFKLAKVSVATDNQAIKDAQKQLNGLTVGTQGYKSELATLHGLEQQRAADLAASADAMKQVSSAQASANSSLSDLIKQHVLNGSALQDAQNALNNPRSSRIGGSQGVLGVSLSTQQKLFNSARSTINDTVSTYKSLVEQGINPATIAMSKMHDALVTLDLQMAKTDPAQAFKNLSAITPIVTKFTQMLGIAPNPKQQAYLNSIPGSITKAMETYTHLTGRIASRPLADILFNNRHAATAVAKFLATTKDKFKSKKFEADLHIVVKGAEAAQRKGEEVARKIAQAQEKVQRLQRLPQGATLAPSTDVSKALQKAQGELQKLQNKQINIKANIQPKDPWKAFKTAPNLNSATSKIITEMSSAGTSAGQGFKAAFDTEAQALAASGALTITVFKKSIGAHSPATKFMPIGQSAMQGVILGMVNEAEGGKTKADIAKAVKTIQDAMLSAWQGFHDTAAQNFGELFTGTDKFGNNMLQNKVDWGERLNIKDLSTNLRIQLHAFNTNNREIQKLQRSGAPLALVQQLRALGPAANSELEALNGATKHQLRNYFRLYQESQNSISRSAKDAFDTQRKQWMAHGRDMAVGILLGLKQGQPQLERYFKHLAEVLINGLRRHNKSHSPSQLYFDEGRNMMLGLNAGIASVDMQKFGRGGVGRVYGRGHGGNTYNIEVNAHNDETFSTTMKRLEFRLRHA